MESPVRSPVVTSLTIFGKSVITTCDSQPSGPLHFQSMPHEHLANRSQKLANAETQRPGIENTPFKTSPMVLRSWDVQRQASRLPSLGHPQSQICCRTPFQHSPTHSNSPKDQPINSHNRCLPSFAWQFMQPELHGTSPKHDHHTLPRCSAAEDTDGQFQVAFLQHIPHLPGGHLYRTRKMTRVAYYRGLQ